MMGLDEQQAEVGSAFNGKRLRAHEYLRGKSVLITGGSSGIGYALAREAVGAGAKVIVASDDPARLRRAVDSLGGESDSMSGVVCDIARDADVVSLGDYVSARVGCLDILINNAGFATYHTFEESSLEEITRLANVNYVGALRCTRVVLAGMRERRCGQIVNIASIAGALILTPNAVYCGSKHGMVAWSECLRYELQPLGIRVNVVCPGRVETPFFHHETFRNRLPRAEANLTVPMDAVVAGTLTAILKNRPVTYIPGYLGYLAWMIRAFPLITAPLYGRLLANRVRALDRLHQDGPS